tara:strand:+ start:619 stop:867 length:249 start_codon:yes stop_codon:yes gene_type:complete
LGSNAVVQRKNPPTEKIEDKVILDANEEKSKAREELKKGKFEQRTCAISNVCIEDSESERLASKRSGIEENEARPNEVPIVK